VAQDLITSLFDIFKEQKSAIMVKFLSNLAPQILQALVLGIEKADDPSYFGILSQYTK
jgi:hypothetical protein